MTALPESSQGLGVYESQRLLLLYITHQVTQMIAGHEQR